MSIAIAGSSLSRPIKGMKVLMLKYWRNENRYTKRKEMSILSGGQKMKETVRQ
jgi:hypothetical protein